MAMEWQRVSLSGSEDTDGVVTVDRHWYLTEDRSRVVEEGHPDSRWLWASPGTQVPRRDAIRLGALKEDPVQEAAVAEEPEAEKASEDEAPAEEKQAKPAANKAAKKASNKAADKAEDK